MGGNTTICSCDEDLTTDRLGESSWTAWVVSRAVGEDGELPGQVAGGQSIRHHGYSFLGTGYSTRLQQGFLRNDTRAEFPKELNVKHARVISVSVSEEGEVTTVHR